MCDEGDLFRFFNFPNRTQAEELQSQLCNLTVEEGRELFNDFRDNFDLSSALSEVGMRPRCVGWGGGGDVHVCVCECVWRVCECECVCVCMHMSMPVFDLSRILM